MTAPIPASGAGFGTARCADPGRPRKAGRSTRWTPAFPGTGASPATRPGEGEAVELRSRARNPWRSRFRRRARNAQATATATGRAARESSGSAVFHRGSGSGSRPRREKPTRETRPTSVRRSMFRRRVIRQLAWKASAGPAGSQGGSHLSCYTARASWRAEPASDRFATRREVTRRGGAHCQLCADLIYGSNWPVSERIAPYETAFKIVREYFAAKGQEATEKYFWRNSKAAYRWGV